MTVTVRLFAKLRDLAGTEAVTVGLPPGATVADLRELLGLTFPELAGLLERSAIAVNHDFAANGTVLSPDAEIAAIPPVSGG